MNNSGSKLKELLKNDEDGNEIQGEELGRAIEVRSEPKTEVSKLEKEYLQRLLELDKITAIHAAKSDELDYLDSAVFRLNITSYVTICVGLLLSGCGFYLWYHRLQRFQDQMMRKESN